MKRRTFSADQKAAIIWELLQSGDSIVSVAKRYDITPSLLTKWRDQAKEKLSTVYAGGTQEQRADKKKIAKLERALGKIASQNDFLERVLRALD